MGRIIIFTGKGGVGKTSVAAAHAVISASDGKKTLLVSTDMAHNLGDLFETEAGREIKTVMDCLDILELDPDWLMQHEYPDLSRVLRQMIGDNGSFETKPGEHFLLPGFENLFSLLKIRKLYLSGDYDRIIVDCAPTGETLSLLKLPELLTWYMEKFFPVGKFMVRILSPISKLKYKVSLPNHKAMDDIEKLHAQLVLLQELLQNPEVCTVRLVCIPEKMVVEETKRNYMYLNLYGYQVDGVFINRILPMDTGNDFMDRWREIQKPYIEELERVFVHVPINRIPWYPEEIRGMEAVKSLSMEVLQQPDLFALPPRMDREVYLCVPEGYRLMIPLPGAGSLPLKVKKYQLDLDITLNNYNRRIPLPNTLKDAGISEVIQEKDILSILFTIDKNKEEKEDSDWEIQKRKQEREANSEKRKDRIRRFRRANNQKTRREEDGDEDPGRKDGESI